MSNLNAMREEIAGKLNAAGVSASLDPQCQVPVVLVAAPTVLGSEGVGGWSVEFPIQILGTPPGDLPSLIWMLDTLEQVLVLFPGEAGPRTIEHIGKETPAYVLTVTRSVTNPNC